MTNLMILASAAVLATVSLALAQGEARDPTPTLPDISDGAAFHRSAQAMFSRWDLNRDGRLEGGEFADGLRTVWSDGDRLDRIAFERGWSDWFPRTEPPGYDTLDVDDSGTLSREEMRQGLDDADLSAGWQGAEDGYLTPEEFETGLRQASEG